MSDISEMYEMDRAFEEVKSKGQTMYRGFEVGVSVIFDNAFYATINKDELYLNSRSLNVLLRSIFLITKE